MHERAMRTLWTVAVAACACLASKGAAAAEPKQDDARPKIEIVFAIDTTGSMGGLIQAAKTKVWSLVNQIGTGKPTPDIRVGLIAYRDRGDDYVTKVIDLTADLDAMYTKLMAFAADGGGDGPESVNQALNDAVNKVSWSTKGRVLKMVFLVGDAPPHMDYTNDVKYPELCQQAARKGIIVHTIRCGADSGTEEVWKKIAHLSEGRYFSIAQSGGVAEIVTPYDAEIAKLDSDLRGTTVYYGDRRTRDAEVEKAKSVDMAMAAAPAEAKAERAAYGARMAKSASVATIAAVDLVAAVETKSVDLDKVPAENLPEELKKMSSEQRKVWLEKKSAERKALQDKLEGLNKKRAGYISEETKKDGQKDGFDSSVLDAVREKSAKIGLTY
jgi:Mg-chelatase subunit ChlD